ncbi:unnamed protein product [Trifolium pratense]|uniref:Uncharacterized protein n=1 Tax=Trifolium pratense TaxID=57577 RepID=A0ACB0KPI2_TRIPR|nr:unnamed protein product [Trifolium pratense]
MYSDDRVKMETDLDDYDIDQQMQQLKEAELEACKGNEDALRFHANRWSDRD